MTRREAKRAVCKAMAQTLWSDLAGAGYIFEREDDADVERMEKAAQELYEEMSRRAGELSV